MEKIVSNASIKFDLEQHPDYTDLVDLPPPGKSSPQQAQPVFRGEKTLHEGIITYHKYWNFYVRVGTPSQDQAYSIDKFPDYENVNQRIFDLLDAIGVTTGPPSSESEVWNKTATIWKWLGNNVSYNPSLYAAELIDPSWPSIDLIARFYETHGHLVWAACFSKAHLFASLLGRIMPRWRVCIANTHHTGFNNQYPPTATHVYVAIYLADRWFYLDPTAVGAVPELPGFIDRGSVGYPTFASVDYEHPYQVTPLPLSTLTKVPLLKP